ncbi:hypothetical protein SCHPADRAFT_702315 [Schizopora paradoxa]|uniref:Uncharacterized protein n=1 Tax=Schizopora paradoxa TaxID=27342 RepID=A0A0H2R997_9AGAM|nr:hypothetical protein SCHPADRAFT_702315 [Schizopora paradoxa]
MYFMNRFHSIRLSVLSFISYSITYAIVYRWGRDELKFEHYSFAIRDREGQDVRRRRDSRLGD